MSSVSKISPETISGDQVTVELSAKRETASAVGAAQGAASVQAVTTTVSGKVGEWIEVAASGTSSPGNGARVIGTNHLNDNVRRLLLKVEDIH